MLVTVTAAVPPYTDMLWPTLQAAIALGGSASIAELDAAVIDREQYSPKQQEVLHGDGPLTEIQYRLGWARTYLKGMGLLTDSKRGVWTVTEAGQAAKQGDIVPLHQQFVNVSKKKGKKKTSKSNVSGELDQVEAEAEADWKDALLETLLKMSPTAFERLAQRLLRESGFSSAAVTGRTGDGGIDGLGVYQISLLSFPVFFQCKRYKGSVGSSAVRDFRGAMAGRGEKGLLITTGSFTNDARAEAKRDGAPPIDLIDGDRLCDLLKENAIGVTTTERVVEDVKVETGYFASLEPK
ncbi:restriction endonuclease [Mycolicibacterium litorale]|uniref:restriction endonuclease n=1 Tax=Mycolicibacterium litorale TaxID=758802 RepID=UPI001065B936|nr:restriction endonuclease [Mycolicibacterium litorale]MCV7416903.1 restriction endonuclease [Mycolicibacterium litorale]